MELNLTDDVSVMTVQVPTGPQVFTVAVPGIQGIPGPANTLSIGTVTTGASAAATITGTSPNQVLNLTIPSESGSAASDPNTLVRRDATGNFYVNDPTNGFHPANQRYVDGIGTASSTPNTIARRDGNGDVLFNQVGVGASAPTAPNHLARKDYVDGIGTAVASPGTVVRRDGGGQSNFQSVSLVGQTNSDHATRKDYVDTGLGTKAALVHTHTINDLTATGTKDATTFLRGDGTWAVPAGGGGGTVTVANITDATAIGRTILTSADAAAVRTNIGAGTSNLALGSTGTTAAAGNHSHTAANISDSTTVGRSVLTAVDAPAARTAIGAGTSSLAIGTTSTTAKAGDYQPTSANISDATAAATANMVIKRDAAGRAAVASPSASTDIAIKSYVDSEDALYLTTAKTASYTLALADAGTVVQMNLGTALTLTVPLNSVVAFPIGTWIDIERTGAGTVTIAATGGVTINTTDASLVLRKQNSRVRLHKTATDTWVLGGDAGPAYNGALVLAAAASVPAGTPANTIIFRTP